MRTKTALRDKLLGEKSGEIVTMEFRNAPVGSITVVKKDNPVQAEIQKDLNPDALTSFFFIPNELSGVCKLFANSFFVAQSKNQLFANLFSWQGNGIAVSLQAS